MISSMDLSVVIVNYNVRHFLEQCLISVKVASGNLSCETIVIDNNSADGSCSMISTSFPWVKLIRNNNNAGFSSACNQGIRIASGEYILLLNPDTVVEENTFKKCIGFMSDHPAAGAIGVKMLDGKGKLLPESKRAFPTPSAAFFKLTGLSGIFPRSSFFNRYYLRHINDSETTEAEILSGAFMFIRKTAIEKTGLLDESFFMYGEDIDLSYRLVRAGFKNYYYPGVKIIHYKGESTKKGAIYTTLHFYRAMLIFIRKHFSGKEGKPFMLIVRSSIYLFGTLAVLKNFFARYYFLLADAIVIFAIFSLIIPFWGEFRFGSNYHYPAIFSLTIIPLFIITSIISVYTTGGYKLPARPWKVFRGLLASSAFVLVIYALLPLNYRFSRAVVIFGSLTSMLLLPSLRIILSVLGVKSTLNPFARITRIAIVCHEESYPELRSLIAVSGKKQIIAGRVSIKPDDLGKDVLGSISQVAEIIRVNKITRIVFSAVDLSASQLIETMQVVSGSNVDIRISRGGGNLIIGSRSSFHMDEF